MRACVLCAFSVEGRGQATIGEVKYREKHVTTADEDDTATEATTSTAVAATKELERERSRLNMSHTRIKSSLDRLKKQRSLLENLAGKMKPGQNKVDQGANGAFSFGAKAEATVWFVIPSPWSSVETENLSLAYSVISYLVLRLKTTFW